MIDVVQFGMKRRSPPIFIPNSRHSPSQCLKQVNLYYATTLPSRNLVNVPRSGGGAGGIETAWDSHWKLGLVEERRYAQAGWLNTKTGKSQRGGRSQVKEKRGSSEKLARFLQPPWKQERGSKTSWGNGMENPRRFKCMGSGGGSVMSRLMAAVWISSWRDAQRTWPFSTSVHVSYFSASLSPTCTVTCPFCKLQKMVRDFHCKGKSVDP